jgi:hypothetical protein
MSSFARSRALSALMACALVALAALPDNPSVHAESEGPLAQKLYLPVVQQRYPPSNPFGFESTALAYSGFPSRAGELKGRWIRLNGISWRDVQPSQKGDYLWDRLAGFEQELLAIAQLGLSPIVVVDDAPRWATVFPSSCAAIHAGHFDDFAAFMAALAARYGHAPYNVHYWELGNEVDTDPMLVPIDSIFGCWGDHTDPFYGGRHYGNMLKVVTPAIKQVDSAAKILTGGLMVSNVSTQTPDIGKPEKFLNGILEAGAAPYFDIVSYHGHTGYYGAPYEDNRPGNPWTAYGSGLDAKANFIKSILKSYGVSKPLFLDEASYTCPDWESMRAICDDPPAQFYDEQANFVIRGYTTALSAGVEAVVWYTLEGPGWQNTGLLDGSQKPRPVFQAYKTLIEQVTGATLPPISVEYGEGVRGWRYDMGDYAVDVVYASYVGTKTISWPAFSHIAIYNRFGQPLTPNFASDRAVFVVTAQPIFIHRKP